jgi:hypothetical protein
MANAGTELSQLHDWVVDLTNLNLICINKSFGAEVPYMTLNGFAQAKVISTVGAGNLYNFGVCVHQQFPDYDPEDADEVPGDQSSFADLADIVGPLTLQQAVAAYVKAAVSAQGKTPSMKATLATQFTQPAWNSFLISIHTCNLDSVLGDPAAVTADLNALYADAAQSKLSDLVRYLFTIQPVPGGDQ